MEVLDKREYFRFYNHHRSMHSNKSKIKHQTKKYEGLKPLPHISEEYNYRITNHLLIKKIISPRRDKVIMHSLEGVGKNSSGHSRSGTRQRWRTSHKNRSLQMSKQNHSHSTKLLGQDEGGEAKITIIRRKPKNIGKVVFNKYRGSPYTTIHSNIDQEEPNICNLTELTPIPATKSFHREKQNNQKKSLQGSFFNNPQSGFGFGPTIIKITDMRIDENPSIKPDTLVQFQLIERSGFRQEIQRIFLQKKEKTIKTKPFEYSQLPQENDPDTFIKFNLSLTKVGDFIPLRIWKYTGVESSLVGTVDLPLISYGDEEESLSNEPRQVKQKTIWQTKKGDPNYTRKVIYGVIERKVMKVNMRQGETTVFLKYKVYPKKFKKIKEDPCIES